MDQQQKQQSFQLPQNIQNRQNISAIPINLKQCEQRKQAYFDFIQKYIQVDKSLKKEVYLNKMRSSFIYNPAQQQQDFQIILQSNTLNFDVIQCYIKYRGFTTSIKILCLNQVSKCHKLKINEVGVNSSVYFCECFNQKIAVKCFKYDEKDDDEDDDENDEANIYQAFHNVVLQYVINKIASCLEGGCQVSNALGWDLIIYQNCIQFALQKCEKIQNAKEYENIKLNLVENLYNLHRFKIIHFDIKPQNIMYSPTLAKYIFIDFGFSRIIKQQIGYKTLTNFRGTPTYCTKQLLKLSIAKEDGEVDLYNNDAECLRNFFEVLDNYLNEDHYTQQLIQQRDQQTKDLSRQFFLSKAKYLIMMLAQDTVEYPQLLTLGEAYPQLTQRYLKKLILFGRYLENKVQFQKIIYKFLKLTKNEEIKNNLQGYYNLQEQQNFEQEDYNSSFNIGKRLIKQLKCWTKQDFKTAQKPMKTINMCDFIQKKLSNDTLIQTKQQFITASSLYLFITNILISFETKISCCQGLKFFSKLTSSGITLYYQTLKFCLNYSIQPPISWNKIVIYMQVILTLVILEKVDQVQVLQCLHLLLSNEKLQFIYKLHIILTYLQLIEWIDKRYITSYNKFSLILEIHRVSSNALKSQVLNIETQIILKKIFLHLLNYMRQIYQFKYRAQLEKADQFHQTLLKKLNINVIEISLLNRISKYLQQKFIQYYYQKIKQFNCVRLIDSINRFMAQKSTLCRIDYTMINSRLVYYTHKNPHILKNRFMVKKIAQLYRYLKTHHMQILRTYKDIIYILDSTIINHQQDKQFLQSNDVSMYLHILQHLINEEFIDFRLINKLMNSFMLYNGQFLKLISLKIENTLSNILIRNLGKLQILQQRGIELNQYLQQMRAFLSFLIFLSNKNIIPEQTVNQSIKDFFIAAFDVAMNSNWFITKIKTIFVINNLMIRLNFQNESLSLSIHINKQQILQYLLTEAIFYLRQYNGGKKQIRNIKIIQLVSSILVCSRLMKKNQENKAIYTQQFLFQFLQTTNNLFTYIVNQQITQFIVSISLNFYLTRRLKKFIKIIIGFLVQFKDDNPSLQQLNNFYFLLKYIFLSDKKQPDSFANKQSIIQILLQYQKIDSNQQGYFRGFIIVFCAILQIRNNDLCFKKIFSMIRCNLNHVVYKQRTAILQKYYSLYLFYFQNAKRKLKWLKRIQIKHLSLLDKKRSIKIDKILKHYKKKTNKRVNSAKFEGLYKKLVKYYSQ